MQVQKLRGNVSIDGLIPAGRYFEQLAANLRETNEREAQRRRALDAEDRELEALYRRASASRGNTHAGEHAMM